MPIHVRVLSAADYSAWVAGEEEDRRQGRRPGQRSSRSTNSSPAARRSTQPTARPATSPLAARAPARSNRSTARRWCSTATQGQIAVVLNGRNNGAIPSWKHFSDTEIAAVITYTKNNWSNKTGQVVQPAAVVAARQ